MREETLHNYYHKLVKTPKVQQFILDHTDLGPLGFRDCHPIMVIADKLNAFNHAGEAYGSYRFKIGKWVLGGETQAKSTVRHELAHCLHAFATKSGLEDIIQCSPCSHRGGMAHGKEYHAVLKTISPKLWRRDIQTPTIEYVY